MKHSLYLKFLFGYLILGVLCFITIATLSDMLTQNYLIEKKAAQMYNEAQYLASYYMETYDELVYDEDILTHQTFSVATYATYFENDVWLASPSGEILYDSTEKYLGTVIDQFDPAIVSPEFYSIGTYYDTFNESVISVAAPISANFRTYAYIILHKPIKSLTTEKNEMLKNVYITAAVIYVLSFILIIVFRNIVALPLKQITKAASEYAAGNLQYELRVDSEDEIGYLANTLDYMSKELSQSEEYQRKFISNISHDFRSPLTCIKGYLEAMIDGTIPPEMHEKYMNLVISETERLTNLTTSTLALKSLESKGTYLDLSDFDINQVIKATAAAFEGICLRKKLIIDLTFSEKELYVHADKGKIQQVLYNLLDNAIKFSFDNSIIWLETKTVKSTVFISVKDSGMGIPKGSIKKIWDRFYKSDPSRGRDKKGTGLGLSIAKEIIQAHQQTIDVISTEGAGTEFIFTLNASEEEEE